MKFCDDGRFGSQAAAHDLSTWAAGNGQKRTLAAKEKPRPEDVSSPDAIIKAMYDTISGPAGPRNWYRERSLFLDGARLIPIGNRVHKESDLQVI